MVIMGNPLIFTCVLGNKINICGDFDFIFSYGDWMSIEASAKG